MDVFVQAYVSNDFVITLLYSFEYFSGFVEWLGLHLRNSCDLQFSSKIEIGSVS